MIESNLVSLTLKERIAQVQISRASSLNALNVEVLEGIIAAMQKLQALCSGPEAYREVRAAVLRGEGDKAFVAGADIKLMQNAPRAQVEQFIRLGQQAMNEVERTPLPVAALVQGFALGGGLELALACDLIIAGEKARLGQPEVNLGLIPGFGGTQRLPLRVGLGTAKRLIYTGEPVKAQEALAIGLVDYLAPADELEAKAAEVLGALSSKAPLALAAAKRSIENLSRAQKEQGLAQEIEEFLNTIASQDAQEGLSAFIEKRTAQFDGK